MLRDRYLAPVQLACYEGEDETAAAAAAEAAAAEAAAAEAAAANAGKTFTQDQVNKYLAEDRRKTEAKHKAQLKAELQKQEALYNKMLENKDLTEQERDGLRESLVETQQQLYTEKELAAKTKKQLEEQYTAQLTAIEKRAQGWESRFKESSINRQLQDAAVTGEAYNSRQMMDLLRPKTKLAEVKDALGKDTGEYQVVVDLEVVVDGKPTILTLSPADAVKRMKEMPEQYGNLFKSNVVSGMGGNSGADAGAGAGGKIDLKNMTQEQYRKIRKEHPELLGLK